MTASHFNDPDHWRDRAAEMRALAAATKDPVARQTMLDNAAEYDHLAERADLRAGGPIKVKQS